MTPAEEAALLDGVAGLSFKPFEFHGWTGNRETVSFGWRYDFSQARVEPAPPLPDFLRPLRARAAAFAGLAPEAFEQGLVIRYDVGAGIGWHRDRPVFDRVFGLSLLSPCVLRFRRPRHEVRSFRARCATALRVSAGWRDPPRVGTQHHADAGAALLHHVQEPT